MLTPSIMSCQVTTTPSPTYGQSMTASPHTATGSRLQKKQTKLNN
jgi:hypothetical protein